MYFRLKNGLDIPVTGRPVGGVQSLPVRRIALVGADYGYPRVSLDVSPGDRVKEGQTLFRDRRYPEIRFTAPACGTIREVRRGLRRRLETVVIDADGDDAIEFPVSGEGGIAKMASGEIRRLLLESGLWTAFRARPFDRIPPPGAEARAVFVTAIDTNPHAADPFIAIDEQPEFFRLGVLAVSRLHGGTTYVCTPHDKAPPLPTVDDVAHMRLAGPHPAGLPGTHIAAAGIDVGERPENWYLSAQDVIAIGRLLSTGRLCQERLVGLAGPGAHAPRLLRVRLGAELAAFPAEEDPAGSRVLSGSLLSGRDTPAYLGRYHHQVTLLPRRGGRINAFSQALRMILRGAAGRERSAAAETHGWAGGMLPLETLDRVWPFSPPPAPLLRALLSGDDAEARRLGCLALGEEDLALVSYVAADKQDYSAALRKSLDRIARTVA